MSFISRGYVLHEQSHVIIINLSLFCTHLQGYFSHLEHCKYNVWTLDYTYFKKQNSYVFPLFTNVTYVVVINGRFSVGCFKMSN